MAETYDTCRAQARFAEILRKVRAGQRIVITCRGEAVAGIRPIEATTSGLVRSLPRMEEQGLVSRWAKPTGPLRRIAKKPGALARFLASRQ